MVYLSKPPIKAVGELRRENSNVQMCEDKTNKAEKIMINDWEEIESLGHMA